MCAHEMSVCLRVWCVWIRVLFVCEMYCMCDMLVPGACGYLSGACAFMCVRCVCVDRCIVCL